MFVRKKIVLRPELGTDLVYFVQCVGGAVKVGWTTNIVNRFSGLQNSQAYPLRLLAVTRGGKGVERNYHRIWADQRLQGERFEPSWLMLGEIYRLRAMDMPLGRCKPVKYLNEIEPLDPRHFGFDEDGCCWPLDRAVAVPKPAALSRPPQCRTCEFLEQKRSCLAGRCGNPEAPSFGSVVPHNKRPTWACHSHWRKLGEVAA